MIETILMVIVAVAIAAILFFLLRNGLNAPIGDLSIAQVIVCAVGGILGAALLIILSFFGIII